MHLNDEEDFGTAFARLREAFYQQYPDQANSFNDACVDMFCFRVHCSRHPSEIPHLPILFPTPQSRLFLASCQGNEALHSNEVIVLTA
jgi:hypothetical protein